MPSDFISMPSKKFTLGNFDAKELEEFINPKYTEKCEKCGKLYRSANSEMVWAKRYPQYKNYCEACYKEEVNKNPSEEQINEWAEACVEIALNNPYWPRPFDISDEVFKTKVQPIVDRRLEEIKNKKKKDAHQEMIDRALKIYNEAYNTCSPDGESYDYHGNHIMADIRIINIIANLLERIEKLENNSQEVIFN